MVAGDRFAALRRKLTIHRDNASVVIPSVSRGTWAAGEAREKSPLSSRFPSAEGRRCRSRMRGLSLAATKSLAILLLAAITLIACQPKPDLPKLYPVPNAHLIDETGRLVQLNEMKG